MGLKNRVQRERKSSGYVDMAFGLSWLLVVCWQFRNGNPEYAGWEVPLLIMGLGMGIHAWQGWYRTHDWNRGKWYWRFCWIEMLLILVAVVLGFQVHYG